MARPGNRDRGLFLRDGVWWIRWRDHTGKDRRRKVGGKKEAALAYARAVADSQRDKAIAAQDAIHAPPDILTVAKLVDRYAESTKRELANWKRLELYGRYWTEFLGDRPIEVVTPYDVDAYKGWRLGATHRRKYRHGQKKTVGNATVNKEIKRLGHLYELAKRDGLTEKNPVRRVKLLPEPPGLVRYLFDEEEARLREVFDPREFVLVEVAYRTGLRQAEQFTLNRSQCDFQGDMIHLTKTKNQKGRNIPMSPRLRAVLLQHLATHTSWWVFPSENPESHICPNNFVNRVFKPALKDASIPSFTWHCLRHTYASRLMMRGADIREVMELMGHSSIVQTMRYAHLAPGRLRITQALLD